MLTQHIALVADGDAVSLIELARVSAALQRQVTRDLGPSWGVVATVDAFPRLDDVPLGYWPLLVCGDPLGTEQGVHVDRDGQPYARVAISLAWSLDASRACLEMLVDPFGSRTALAVSPRGDRDAAEVLVEVCAPCAGAANAYSLNDVIVSDFCMPSFFDGAPADRATRYSWSGALEKPLQVLPGGHLTWYEHDADAWWVRSHYGDNPIDVELGSLAAVGSARALLRERAPQRPPLRSLPLALAAQLQAQRQHALRSAVVRAERLRGQFLEAHLVHGPAAALPPDPGEQITAAGELMSPVAAEPPPVAASVPPDEPLAPEMLIIPGTDPSEIAAAPATAPDRPRSMPPALRPRQPASSLPPSLGGPTMRDDSLAPGGSVAGVRSVLPSPPRRFGRDALLLWSSVALLGGGLLAVLIDAGATTTPAVPPRATAAAPAAAVASQPPPVSPPVAAPSAATPAAVAAPESTALAAPAAQPAPTAVSKPRALASVTVLRSEGKRARAQRTEQRAVATPATTQAPVAPPAPSTPAAPVLAVTRPGAPLTDLLDTRQ